MADLRLLLLLACVSYQAVAYVQANPAALNQASIYQQPIVRVVGSGYDPSTGVYVHDYGRDGIQALGDSLVITDSAYPLNPLPFQPRVDHLYSTSRGSHSSHARNDDAEVGHVIPIDDHADPYLDGHRDHDGTQTSSADHEHGQHGHHDHSHHGHDHAQHHQGQDGVYSDAVHGASQANADDSHAHAGQGGVDRAPLDPVPEFRGHSHDDNPGPQQFFHQGSSNLPTGPSGALKCTSEGLFRHPNDCTKFYRCVNAGDLFLQAVEFNCASGLAFDETSAVCTWPENAYSCNQFSASPPESVNARLPVPTSRPIAPSTAAPTIPPRSVAPPTLRPIPPRADEEDPRCVRDGLLPAPKCSRRFYRCESLPNGDFRLHKYTCYEGMVFDPQIPGCIESENVPECRRPASRIPSTTSTTPRPQARHPAEEPSQVITAKKVMKNCSPEFEGDKCTPFYKCQMEQPKRRGKTFRFECPLELVFNELTQDCAYPTEVDGCRPFIQGDETVAQKPKKQVDVPESSVVSFPCVREGFFKDAQNCSRFIRCFYTTNTTATLRAARFDCPRGLLFDESAGSCNHAGLVPGCSSAIDHSNEILTMRCEFDPVYQDLCTPFYRCFDDNRRPMRFSCPKDLVYDVSTQKCNYPNNVSECRTPPPPKNEATPAGRFCSEDGFIRSSTNCSLFYRCTRLNNRTEDFSTHLFSCPPGLAFDYTIDACNYENLVSDCGGNVIPDTRKRAALAQELSTYDSKPQLTFDRRQGINDFEFDQPRAPASLGQRKPIRGALPRPVVVDFPLDDEPLAAAPPRRSTGSATGESGFSFRPGSAVSGGQPGAPSQPLSPRPLATPPPVQRPSRRPLPSEVPSSGFGFRPGTAVNPVPQLPVEPTMRPTHPVRVPSPSRPNVSIPPSQPPARETPSTGFDFRPGSGSNEDTSIPSATEIPEDDFLCPSEGFFRDVDNCHIFHRCVQTDNPRRPLKAHTFKCKEGLVFDDLIKNCNFQDAVPECGTVAPAPTQKPNVGTQVTERAGLRRTTVRPSVPSEPTFAWRPGAITEPPRVQPARTQRPVIDTGSGSGEVIREDLPREPLTTSRPRRPIAGGQPGLSIPSAPSDPLEKTPEILVSETDVVFDSRTDSGPPAEKAVEIPVSLKCNPEVFYKRSTRFCTPYYRCIRTVILDDGVKQREISDTYRYACPKGLVFNRDIKTCDYPSRVADCDQENPAEELVAPSVGSRSTIDCTREGYFAEPGHCGKYYRCVHIAKRRFFSYEFECPRGFVFNEDIGNCDYPENVRGECRGRLSLSQPRCTRSEDLVPSSSDCNTFYRCWKHEGEGTLRSVPLACPKELVLTIGGENGIRACDWPKKEDSCYRDDRHKRIKRLSKNPGKH